MNLRIGRFISVADIEAQLAPDNLMSTRSLLYTLDIYTQVGGIATIKLNGMWAIQLGLVAGNDVAPWEHRRFTIPSDGPTQPVRTVDHGIQPTGVAMIQWIGPKWALGEDSVYFGVNGINDGRFGYNNIQELPVVTWTHKFDEHVYTMTEGWYMYERDNPVLGYTWEAAVVNYTMFRLAQNTFLTVRNEWFDDAKGARTGTATQYLGAHLRRDPLVQQARVLPARVRLLAFVRRPGLRRGTPGRSVHRRRRRHDSLLIGPRGQRA